ncbi:ABC transporter ATP-binding protein [Cellulosilyticum lentocellum]|uniref:Xenobiotic-transporting ATPase n=1 Tax=Cellulosilyticum lentocellum (strain ATCC 49066 / DSM 5427 / NCIMB 11756 / RHM5) TaxID=642492 RepID=F2JJG8_CELLD|nr:ABC transporter ATP-binding protein [Cellulosilyticum lentocellum]ADZ85563.1 Xenobiotic-transporting ATPase [Cellulosilyticum lentocellum DSM 5427]
MKKIILKYKLLFSIVFMLKILIGIIFVSVSICLQRIVDAAVSGNSQQFYRTILWAIGYFVIVGLMDYLNRTIEAYYMTKTLCHFKKKIFKGLFRQDYTSFYKENTSVYLSSLTNDIHLMDKNYINPALGIVMDLVIIVGSTGVLIWFNIWIALAMILTSTIILFIPKVFGNRLASTRARYSEGLSELTKKLKDMFLGYEVVKSYHMDDQIIEEFQECNKEVEKRNYTAIEATSRTNALASYLSIMTQLVAIGLGGYFVIKGNLTIGTLFAIVQLGVNLGEPITMIIEKITMIKSMQIVKDRLLAFIDIEDVDENRFIELKEFKSSIQVEDVTFGYEEGYDILKSVSLQFEKNKKYAIVGASGSGKSTLLKLLLDEYIPRSGHITIDGQQLQEVLKSSLYQQLAIIHQNVYLFDKSLKENITLGKCFQESEIEEAMQKSAINEFLNKRTYGEDETLGEDGNKLSGGQRQRVAIARALIQRKPILLLDEYTSSLDSKVAYAIEDTILNLQDVTVVSVTHKLMDSLLKRYDRIIVMEDGRVVEQGGFQELLEKRQVFYKLYHAEHQMKNTGEDDTDAVS